MQESGLGGIVSLAWGRGSRQTINLAQVVVARVTTSGRPLWQEPRRRMPRNSPTNALSPGCTAESLRSHLRQHLASRYPSESGAAFIDELGLCQGSARMDLAVVNGQLHGYEIKSERDNLRRLRAQSALYSRVFDRVTLVCSERHVYKALDIIPDWWEVLRILHTNQGITFKLFRRGRKNPQKNARALVEFLWLEEAVALLGQHDALRGLRGKPRAILWDRLCDMLGPEEVAAVVCAHLKATAEMRGRPAPQL